MTKRKLLCTILILLTVCNPTINVSANSNIIKTNTDISIMTSDVIEYKYRINSKGQLQYRRWNATKDYWIDATWLNVN